MFTIDDLLGEQLTMDTPTILEKTLCSIRTHTITYQGIVSALRRNKKQDIKSKLEELNSILDDGDNEYGIGKLENELKDLMDEMLHEQSSFFKNHELLNDCKITKDFIKLESRKS